MPEFDSSKASDAASSTWPTPDPDRLPRIVVLFSHLRLTQTPSRLALEVHDVLPEFAGRADVRVVDRLFDRALEYAQELERTQGADLLLCGGATGAFLRKHLQLPVVRMRSNGLDALHALVRARRVSGVSEPVAVLTYREVDAELESIRGALSMDIRQAAYTNLEEARAQVCTLAQQGCRAVIGSSMVTEIADEQGLVGIPAISGEVCRQAIEDALDLWRSSLQQQKKRQRLDAILHQLRDGVLALDKNGRVESLNVAMARLLNVATDWAVGRDIEDVAPGLGLAETLRAGGEFSDKVLSIKGQSVLANFAQLFEGQKTAGAVLTARETSEVQRADSHIRAQTRPGRFGARHVLRDIAAESAQMRAVLIMAERYAQTDSTVLITGDSGTGKELLAQGIHNASRRRDRPFVAINCGALAETLLDSELFGYEEGAFTGSRRGGKPGLFEAAHTGTVFLDEIGDMPLPLQTRLLRVLQEREVLRLGGIEPTPIDVRVIAATHRDLQRAVAAGSFRDDLYYRLQILRLHVPALRERLEDIGSIARQIAQRLERRMGRGSSAHTVVATLLPRLQSYHWPGNVRELESVLERALLLHAFPPDPHSTVLPLAAVLPELFENSEPAETPSGLRRFGKATETAHVKRIVEECDGDLDLAAKRLAVSRSTVWRRLNARS
jgi:propionate catabolism operon transcriptional regulator